MPASWIQCTVGPLLSERDPRLKLLQLLSYSLLLLARVAAADQQERGPTQEQQDACPAEKQQ